MRPLFVLIAAMLTIATLNLHLRSDRWQQRSQLVVEQLLDVSPDVIALQEIALPIRQGHWLRNQLNARAGADAIPYRLVQRRRRSGMYSLLEGVGILSRLPIVSDDVLGLSFGRIAVRANIELPSGETIDIVTTHLHSHRHAPQTRDDQVLRIMGWLDGRSAVQRRIVLGCFREEPGGSCIKRMKQFFGFHSAYESYIGHEPQSTYPTALNLHGQTEGLCHDYIFLSPHVGTVVKAGLCCHVSAADDPTLLPSDHVGIYAQIDLGDA